MPAEVWPADLAAAAADALGRVLDGGMPVQFGPPEPGEPPAGDRARPGRRPGRRLDVSLWYPSRDAEGLVAGVALIAVDHSARHAAAEDLAPQPGAVPLAGAGRRAGGLGDHAHRAVAEDSPAWRWITGQGVEEYLRQGWLGAVHPDDRERVEQTGLTASGPARRSTAGTGSRPGRLLPPL